MASVQVLNYIVLFGPALFPYAVLGAYSIAKKRVDEALGTPLAPLLILFLFGVSLWMAHRKPFQSKMIDWSIRLRSRFLQYAKKQQDQRIRKLTINVPLGIPLFCLRTEAPDEALAALGVASSISYATIRISGWIRNTIRYLLTWGPILSGLILIGSASFPVPQQISDCFAQTRVRLRLLLRELRFQPRMQLLHHRPALRLMQSQTALCGKPLFTRRRIVVINFAERFQNVSALAGEVRRDLRKLTPSMSHTVGQQDLYTNRFRSVSRQRVTHLNRR